MMPSLTGMTWPHRTSIASVPASIKSSLVTTASVRRPVHQKIAQISKVKINVTIACSFEKKEGKR